MSRLSDKYTILFIEEPEDPDVNRLEGSVAIERINKNLTVFTPILQWDGWKIMCQKYVPILQQHVQDLNDSLFWFYSPFYVHILNAVKPSMIVYDCMDELSAFKSASPNLPVYEKQLLNQADIVFTGGKSLYEVKKELHPHVYCFPSSVDRHHFERAGREDTCIPSDLMALPKPIAGYYGVIDERIDFFLLKALAEKMPEMTFVMIGPFAKIEEEDAAQAENIHYLGKKDYWLLPDYLKGIDVAMMPFAIHSATRFISPTKTLEYMAAGKPIVSTPIQDVVRDYRHVVGVASDAGEFAHFIQQYLKETPEEKNKRQKSQQAVIDKTSWDHTVVQMENIIMNTKISSGSGIMSA
jgi:glycosyltransferase involved in cell wall biosynthesis